MVVQTAEVCDGDDPAAVAGRLGDSRDRCILVQRQVSSPLVVVGKVPLKVPTQRTLIPHDHVVEALPPDGADHPFGERILPRSPGAVRTSSRPIAPAVRRTSQP